VEQLELDGFAPKWTEPDVRAEAGRWLDERMRCIDCGGDEVHQGGACAPGLRAQVEPRTRRGVWLRNYRALCATLRDSGFVLVHRNGGVFEYVDPHAPERLLSAHEGLAAVGRAKGWL